MADTNTEMNTNTNAGTAPETQPAAQQNAQQNAQQQEDKPEKLFSQAELDTIVARRLAKATKGMPTTDELAEFKTWKDSRLTEEQKRQQLETERDTYKSDLAASRLKIEQYERERFLISKGITADDVDYYAYKIGKLVTDEKPFEQAATEYLKDNPVKRENGVRVSTGAPLNNNGGQRSSNDLMNDIFRQGRR